MIMFIPQIADSSTSTMDVIDIDVILACFRGTLIIDDELVLLGLQQVVKFKQLGNGVKEYDDLRLGLYL
jgi:hypothetical protein